MIYSYDNELIDVVSPEEVHKFKNTTDTQKFKNSKYQLCLNLYAITFASGYEDNIVGRIRNWLLKSENLKVGDDEIVFLI